MRAAGAALLVTALVAGTACRPRSGGAAALTDSAVAAQRTAHLAQVLAQPDSGATRGAAIARWMLGTDLAEISGLALTADGRLLTHGDETGTVFELDYRRGQIVSQFRLGKETVRADFEGLTEVDGSLYLLASNGKLYEFREGGNGERVKYTVHDPGLQHQCEFEGVAFDPAIHSLLMACKNVRTAGPLRDSLVIYRWELAGGSDSRPSRLTVPLTQVVGDNGWKGLHPSDITVDPTSGNYVLVAGEERALIEITPSGGVVFARPLPSGLAHAEGVAITRDGILIISTEARQHSRAAVTLYRWP